MAGREQGVCGHGGNKQKEKMTKKGLPLKHFISEVRIPTVQFLYTISRPTEILMTEQKICNQGKGKRGRKKDLTFRDYLYLSGIILGNLYNYFI